MLKETKLVPAAVAQTGFGPFYQTFTGFLQLYINGKKKKLSKG